MESKKRVVTRLAPALLGLLLISPAVAWLAGCSPALNWREVRPAGSGIAAMLPCSPDRQMRNLALAGYAVKMQMWRCTADGATFAVGFADMPDTGAVTAAIDELRRLAVGNIDATEPRIESLRVAGMTPNASAAHLSFAGRLPDGSAVHEDALFFARGQRVYQAVVIGAAPAAETVRIFIDGLKLAP